MFTALIIVTIFVNTVPSSYCVYSGCSHCLTEPIDKLNDLQIQQIVSQRSVIEEIEQNPQLLSNATYQRSFVTLTPRQNQQILRKYPKIFREKESVLTSSSAVGTETNLNLKRICPPILVHERLVMLYTEGQLVQVVQVSNGFPSIVEWVLGLFCSFFSFTRERGSIPSTDKKCL